MTRESLRFWSNVALTALVAAILIATLSPYGSAGAGGELFRRLDRWEWSFGLAPVLVHFTLFGAFGVALAARFASSDYARESPRRALLMVLLMLWVFAASTEFAQGWSETREARLGDWLADMTGGLLGFFGGSLILRQILRPAPTSGRR